MTHVTGGLHVAEVEPDTITIERRQEISAEMHAWELVEALKAAVAGAAHWRMEAQALLRTIANGDLPEPTP